MKVIENANALAFFSRMRERRERKKRKTALAAETRAERAHRKRLERAYAFFESVFDEAWYRDLAELGVSADQSAFDHYWNVGFPKGQAPCATLCGPDGEHMMSWVRDYIRDFQLLAETRALPQAPGTSNSEPLLKPQVFDNASGKRLAVYSANFGGYDDIAPVDPSWAEQADFYCFTDGQSSRAEGWTFVSPNYFNVDPRRTARFYKLHPHLYFSNYEWSMWVDGNIALTACPMKTVEIYLGGPAQIVTVKHPLRGCVYEEAFECGLNEKDDFQVMFEQMERYRESGYPPTNGLIESNVMLRRHDDPRVLALMRLWWGEIERGSCRDQLSFNYCLAKSPGIHIDYLPEASARDSRRFELERHLSN